MGRAQSAVEFMIIVGAVLLVFISFLGVINYNISNKLYRERSVEIQRVAFFVQEEIKLAAEASEGYQRSFYVPEKILGENYTITITENLVYFRTEDGKNSLALPIPEVFGQIIKGNNIIRKFEGKIILNQ